MVKLQMFQHERSALLQQQQQQAQNTLVAHPQGCEGQLSRLNLIYRQYLEQAFQAPAPPPPPATQ